MLKHAFLVAGTHSGAGKTTVSLALLAALQERGFALQACKVGPDFIDPSHHELFTQRPSYNLDAWMGGELGMRHVYARMLLQSKPDIVLAEGVMGLFDGAQGLGGLGSSAHCAQTVRMPIVLVLNVRGMGQSAAAMAAGYVRTMPQLSFAGIICTHVGSAQHKSLLEESFMEVFGSELPVLGYMPRDARFALPSRHLGLHMAHETFWTLEKRRALAALAEETLQIDALLAATACMSRIEFSESSLKAPLELSSELSSKECLTTASIDCLNLPVRKPSQEEFLPPSHEQKSQRSCIGIARDAAFAFLYADMPAVLEELGAMCVFFSPLYDTQVPKECTALYFPGGYPELYAEILAHNSSMLQSVRDFAAQDGRIYAECGGFMYLMQSLEFEEKKHKLCGLLPCSSSIGAQKAALGYRQVQVHAKSQLQGRGHEFHYGRVRENLEEIQGYVPLWKVQDRKNTMLSGEACGIVYKNIWASWVHVYPEGARELLAHIFQLENIKENA